nr:NCS2 family permease [Lachnospiraceae bacterium]
MEKLFKLKENGTNVRTEIMAGVTTFMTMAYILAVNPGILSEAGMDFGKVFAATAIASAIASVMMGLYANLPFALSAGMGLNAMFAYTVCLGMGYSWKWALSAILVEGIIFLILTFTNAREAIVTGIPANLKKAIGVGVGFLITFVGLKNGGLIVDDGANLTGLNPEWYKGAPLIAVIGIIITAILLVRKVKGALLIGMAISTLIGIPLGVTTYAGGSYLPSAPYFAEFAFGEITASPDALFDFVIVVFTFLYFDMFDTVGTLIACAGKSGMIKEDGSIPNAKKALMTDAVGTTAGAFLGTSTVTTFIESSAGVAEGGRTGLTAVTVGFLFLVSLFLEPVFGSIPGAATAPALIIVGFLMMSEVKNIDFSDYTEGIPAFMTMIFMVFTSSASDGIMFGLFSYVLLKSFTGKVKEINPVLWIITALFVIKV